MSSIVGGFLAFAIGRSLVAAEVQSQDRPVTPAEQYQAILIAARWNLTTTPTLYVLDARGVIRYKWPGGPGHEAIDAALDKLIKEVEVRR